MATEKILLSDTFPQSGLDSVEMIGQAAQIVAGGLVQPAGTPNPVHGVYVEGAVVGKHATIAMQGIVKMKAGAAIVAGSLVQPDAQGRAVPKTNAFTIGMALSDVGAAEERVDVLLLLAEDTGP